MSSSSSSPSTAAVATVTKMDLDEARAKVQTCGDEIESIKEALRRLATYGPDDDASSSPSPPNQLDIVMIKWDGLPDVLSPTPMVTLQLSSPVEEIRLEQLWDSQQRHVTKEETTTTTTSTTTRSEITNHIVEEKEVVESKWLARFTGVETSMATLTVTAYPHKNSTSTTTTTSTSTDPLGSSEPIDVSLLCPLDAINPQDVYEMEWPVTILKSNSHDDDTTMAVVGASPESSITSTTRLLGTLTLRITYKPSPKDQQEALYENLNKASQRKNDALEQLKQITFALARSGITESNTTSSSQPPPTIPAGFLNHSTSQEKARIGGGGLASWIQRWYERTIGPQSLVRVILPIAKNYIIFFGAVILFHFKGQELALPAPV